MRLSAKLGALTGIQQPTMRCALIVYSTTVILVVMCILSFYLPSMIFQVRANHVRIASAHDAVAQQAHYSMRPLPPPRSHGAKSLESRVMLVTANQPLPCTAQLLLDQKLIRNVEEIPWLATALKRDVC